MGFELADDDQQPDIFTNSKQKSNSSNVNVDANHLLGFSYQEEEDVKKNLGAS